MYNKIFEEKGDERDEEERKKAINASSCHYWSIDFSLLAHFSFSPLGFPPYSFIYDV
jgi:hypothetical protein